MKYFSTKTILIVQAIVLAGLIATTAYGYSKIKRHTEVIDNQGAVIKLLVTIPEINALIARELKKAGQYKL